MYATNLPSGENIGLNAARVVSSTALLPSMEDFPYGGFGGAGCGIEHPLPIGRNCRRPFALSRAQLFRTAAVKVHAPNRRRAPARRSKYDVVSIGRNHRTDVPAGV